MKIRCTELTLTPDNAPIIDERVTIIKIEDEGGGEFISLKQHGQDEVRIDDNEWEYINRAVEQMIQEIKDNQEAK